MSEHGFTYVVGGTPHAITAIHDVLSDRMRVTVDGAPAEVTLVRRVFSSLFRYRFVVAGTTLELRVSPSGLRGIQVTLNDAQEPIGATGLTTGTIAATAGLVGACGAIALLSAGAVTLVPALAIGGAAAVGTFAIVWPVYRRRTD